MAYTPNNGQIFAAALAGGMSGFAVSAPDGSIVSNDYSQQANAAIALAQAVDTAWGANPNNAMDFMMIGVGCGIVMKDRSPTGTANPYVNQSNWTIQAEAIVAAVLKADLAAVADGVTIPDIRTTNNSLVWRPGGVTSGNVYATFSELYDAIIALGKTFYTVSVDTSLSAANVPTGGPYHLGNTTWQSADGFAIVTWDDGATFDCDYLQLRGTQWVGNSASPLWVPTGISILTLVGDGSVLLSSTASPIVHVTAAAAAWLCNIIGGGIGDGTHGVISVDAGANGQVFASAIASIANNALIAGGGGTFTYSADSNIGNNAGSGGWSSRAACSSSLETYTPAVLANWSGTNPTSVANALDRIAAHVGPIP